MFNFALVFAMIVHFEKKQLETWYTTPLDEIKGKLPFSMNILVKYKQRINQLIAISKLEELKHLRSLRFEYLKGEMKGSCSIRLNDQYRLLFTPLDEKHVEVLMINDISKHYE